jgi:hypothetical protein
MTEKRCTKCNRLLYIDTYGIKEIRNDKITYKINGNISVVCKCGQEN